MTYNIKNTEKDTAAAFSKLNPSESFLLSAFFTLNFPLDFFQIARLLEIFLSNGLAEEPTTNDLQTTLDQFCKKGWLTKVTDKYQASDLCAYQAFNYPFRQQLSAQFVACLADFLEDDDFAFEYSIRKNRLSDILLKLYTGNLESADFTEITLDELNENSDTPPPLIQIIHPFDFEIFNTYPTKSRLYLFNYAVYYSLFRFQTIPSADEELNIFDYFLSAQWLKSNLFLTFSAHVLAEHLIFKGNFQRAKSYLEASLSPEAPPLEALIIYFFHGCDAAIELFKQELRNLQKRTKKRNVTFHSTASVFCYLAFLQKNSPDSMYEATKLFERQQKTKHLFKPPLRVLNEFYKSRGLGKMLPAAMLGNLSDTHPPFVQWLACFVAYWSGLTETPEYEKIMNSFADKIPANELALFYNEFLILKANSKAELSEAEKKSVDTWKLAFLTPIAEMTDKQQKWEMTIETLLSKLGLQQDTEDFSIRLIWELSHERNSNRFSLQPKEQQKLKNNSWSVGKNVSFSSIGEDLTNLPSYYTVQDKKIIEAIQNSRPWLDGSIESDKDIFPYLIAHPAVYLNGDYSTPLEIVGGEPILMLRSEANGNFSLRFHPENPDNSAILLKYETQNRLKVYIYSNEQLQAAKILANIDTFPPTAENRLKELLSLLEPLMPVFTSLEFEQNTSPIASIATNSQTHIRLEPSKDALVIKFLVKPFGANGTAFLPGIGDEDVFTEIAGQKLHTKRDFALEKENLKEALKLSPIFQNPDPETLSITCSIEEDALEALSVLQNNQTVSVEWPLNNPVTRIRKAGMSNIKVVVRAAHDWFSIKGDMRIDDDLLIDIKDLVKNYNPESKFVKLTNNDYLLLTDTFRRQIAELAAYTEEQDGNLTFHAAAISAMEELLLNAGEADTDSTWTNLLDAIKSASEKTFVLPPSLDNILREYQKEAFVWLSKMAYLGFGACLSDDMGLGKTLEALSVILTRADKGPTLVITPTSVCSNWQDEIEKFTPELTPPIMFADAERETVLKSLKPYDLVICSYGLLQREAERLAQVDWVTLVLDEAQAIKNVYTGRSQATMLLKAQFKIIMTGTPIENHLGELWNLFRFLNPGLLGSIQSFNRKFAHPIQNRKNKEATEALKKLLSPFILRRKKKQVLKFLPPRTEIVLKVELSQEEASLYESFRRQALERIEQADQENKSAKSVFVLAEIMRLRRLCCNPSLVTKNLQIKSSKLALLESIADSLLATNHKALIFSQFVDHLTIIRELFDSKNINYQYLDGSTPVKDRVKAIKSFQNGEGDFFLISLKAGGLGLNLTEADYVIHMDPWWNPAVEDQASDRAHRLGQTRPVTIYRLITTNTIEEKIQMLHKQKRDLANDLLEGTDISGKISTEELINLIKEAKFSDLPEITPLETSILEQANDKTL
ncbi:MAG: DEAD/DEAH box helicase [Candidatus Riflebacteria bacterium]|nr:DEAD/DEAH box helicase [Candidatus Riflebacteria bacterium]